MSPFGNTRIDALSVERRVLCREMNVSTLVVNYLQQGRIMGSMFFEASTRTFCSFAAAMQRLGGSVIPLKASDSSAMKGETLSGNA